jgi:hypothetical protein
MISHASATKYLAPILLMATPSWRPHGSRQMNRHKYPHYGFI